MKHIFHLIALFSGNEVFQKQSKSKQILYIYIFIIFYQLIKIITKITIFFDSCLLNNKQGGRNLFAFIFESKNQKVQELRNGHQYAVTSVCLSPYGTTLESGSADCSMRLWDLKTGQQKTNQIVIIICFSPDGRTLASSSYDQSIRFWDVSLGKSIQSVEKHYKDFLAQYLRLHYPKIIHYNKFILTQQHSSQVLIYNSNHLKLQYFRENLSIYKEQIQSHYLNQKVASLQRIKLQTYKGSDHYQQNNQKINYLNQIIIVRIIYPKISIF